MLKGHFKTTLSQLLLLGAAVVAAGLLSMQTAFASTATNTISVSATVVNTCTVNTTTLTFGSYTGALLATSGGITLTCTSGTAETIGLDAGANGAHAVGTTRAMANGGSYLSYEIYQDSGHTTVWGSSGLAAETATGTGTQQTLQAYGKIPAGELTAPAGSYTDTVNVTVTY